VCRTIISLTWLELTHIYIITNPDYSATHWEKPAALLLVQQLRFSAVGVRLL
jgi:hypothetical protein